MKCDSGHGYFESWKKKGSWAFMLHWLHRCWSKYKTSTLTLSLISSSISAQMTPSVGWNQSTGSHRATVNCRVQKRLFLFLNKVIMKLKEKVTHHWFWKSNTYKIGWCELVQLEKKYRSGGREVNAWQRCKSTEFICKFYIIIYLLWMFT